jgi:hypothetical protein
VPVSNFASVSVSLTLFDKNDRDVFECLVRLYGFARNPEEKTKPHKSSVIVVHKLDLL